jgi:formylglycine-generating enzyme required for sulfatase activity
MPRGKIAWGAALGLGVAAIALIVWAPRGRVTCGAGFIPDHARCLPGAGCPPPLARVEGGVCEARMRVPVPRTRLSVGPSDWEADGTVLPRVVEAGPLWIDAFEATAAALAGDAGPALSDPLRAASGVTRDEAAAYCARAGGRLPTEDEWMVAASGLGGHRYPWGETGAVCRRAAFGLVHGPCSLEGDGPDTVGAHADGDSIHGVHDLAGNVAEWVAPRPEAPRVGIAKGGSWRSELAAELRVWARLAVDPAARDDRIGVRCAYDAP